MTQKYKLQCGSCNDTQHVEARHAGSVLPCPHCNASVDVPKLRDLKQLERVSSDGPRTQKRGWGRLSGTLFALGLLMLAIAIGAASYLYRVRASFNIYTEKPNVENVEFQLDINKASLTDSWRVWEQLLGRRNIVQRETPYYIRIREQVKRFDFWLKFFYGLATVGLISMVSSLFFRPKLTS